MISKPQYLAAIQELRERSTSRLVNALLAAIAAQLEACDPEWWIRAEEAWRQRYFAMPRQAVILTLAAIHYEALSGYSALAEHFPSCGGKAHKTYPTAIAGFLGAPPERFHQSLAQRSQRHFSLYWNFLWVQPAHDFFHRRGLPYHVVELASSGGLGACADRMRPMPRFDPELILSRTGLDSAPALNLRSDPDKLWLLAGCSPERINLKIELDYAVDGLRGALLEDPEFVRVLECAPTAAPDFIAKQIPASPNEGLLVISSGLEALLPPAQKDSLAKAIVALLACWGDRGLWIDLAAKLPDISSCELRVHRVKDGALQTRVYATFSAGAAPSFDATGNLNFLDSPKPSPGTPHSLSNRPR